MTKPRWHKQNKTKKKKILGRVILIAMITSMFMVVSPMTASADPCDYQICLEDSWGDGWNGGIVDLSVNGVLIYDDLTIVAGSGPECHTFSVNTSDEITTDYIAGDWSAENYYYIKDEDGYVVREEGASGTPGDIGAGELYADCNPPPPDLVITEKTEEWVNATHYNVNYTVCNIGNANANASNTTIYIDGVNSLEDPVPALAPSACDTDTVGPFEATSGSIINVTVCADNLDQVDESDETNNCKTNLFGCGNVPCNCGDICANADGWWRNNSFFNVSGTPIQAAVDNAKVGETICVKNGTYNENVVVTKSHLTIRSENGPSVTTVSASLNPDEHVFNITDQTNVTPARL